MAVFELGSGGILRHTLTRIQRAIISHSFTIVRHYMTRLVDADDDDTIVSCARHSGLDVGHDAKLTGDVHEAGCATLLVPE